MRATHTACIAPLRTPHSLPRSLGSLMFAPHPRLAPVDHPPQVCTILASELGMDCMPLTITPQPEDGKAK